jgi:hypothetical protein
MQQIRVLIMKTPDWNSGVFCCLQAVELWSCGAVELSVTLTTIRLQRKWHSSGFFTL